MYSGTLYAKESIWYKSGDPLRTQIDRLPKVPEQYSVQDISCAKPDLSAPLSLAEVANTSLCNNPLTQELWASTRAQAAQLGIAKSAYLPTLNNTTSTNGNIAGNDSQTRSNPYFNLNNSLAASYLLYDFGNRNATLENARQLLLAASASQNSTIQTVLLTATVAYYKVQANLAAVKAALQAESASLESFKAAEARYKAGVATPADKLQAQTSYAQLTLTRITSEGNLQNAYGNLANVMGLAANQPILLKENAYQSPANILEDVNVMITQAADRRPDLIASEAQLKAAQANIDANIAAAKPSISVGVSNQWQDGNSLSSSNNSSLGLTVSIPLFAGYAPSYRIRAAEAQADLRAAQRDRLKLQISLDVWTAYQNLRTAVQSVTASEVLVKSAEESYRLNLGRYKAGLSNIIDTLNAQSALASAQQQNIQASLNANIARATLAQAMGTLDSAMIQSLPTTATVTTQSSRP
ncbi:MAG: transporter [Methylophilales bacterium 16-45-7]|nr:MAG: transporter [Methylophilales bacterium 16-45-7]